MDKLLTLAVDTCTNAGCNKVDVDGGAAAGIIAGVGIFFIVVILIILALFVFWILMLVDAATRDEKSYQKIGAGEKVVWVTILGLSAFFGFFWLAAILYYFIIKKRSKELEKSQAKKR